MCCVMLTIGCTLSVIDYQFGGDLLIAVDIISGLLGVYKTSEGLSCLYYNVYHIKHVLLKLLRVFIHPVALRTIGNLFQRDESYGKSTFICHVHSKLNIP